MAERVYVVGDLHGCVHELETFLEAIAPTETDTLCFLGDYIDRGQFSKAVVDRLIRLKGEGPHCVFLKGNHEDMFLDFLGLPGQYGESFLVNGGGPTLVSYGIAGLTGQAAANRLPPEHLEFLQNLQLWVCFGDFLCVHAGVRPNRSTDEQSEEDLLWIRGEFILHPHLLPYTVVFGHTPQRQVLLDLPYKIGLDTGLVYGNKLSCLELSEKELIQVPKGARRAVRTSLTHEFGTVPLRSA